MLGFPLALLLAAASTPAPAPAQANPQIDYPGFRDLAVTSRSIAAGRLVRWAAFAAAAAQPDVLILDARSAPAFARGHIAGAVNLPFTDFHRRKPGPRHRQDWTADPHQLQQQFQTITRAGAAQIGAACAQHPDLHQSRRLWL